MTLNQVVARIEKLALSHKQINHFYFGDMVEWLSNADVIYPAVFVDMSNGSISKDSRQTGWDFDFWFCDLVNISADARDNELEVQSDLTSIAEDLKAMLSYTGYQGDWEIGESSALTYYKEKFEDLVLACKMSVRIDVRYDSNRCQVPTDLVFE